MSSKGGSGSDLLQKVLDTLGKHPDGLTNGNLEDQFGKQANAEMARVMDTLMKQNRVIVIPMPDGGFLFKLIAEGVASKLAGLTDGMMAVYSEVQAAGNSAISSRELKRRTNLQANLVDKACKELDKRMLIKRVKSIHQKTQKMWMLFELAPSVDITGGPWYTDNEFDHEFVNEICRIVESTVRKSWESEQGATPTSLQELQRAVASCGVTTEELTTDHIRQIVNRLCFDAKIEAISVNPVQRQRLKDAGPYYRTCADDVTHYDAFTALPCGVCPVFAQCTPGGVVSPQSCVYMEKWWEDVPQTAAAAPGGGASLGADGSPAALPPPPGSAPAPAIEDLAGAEAARRVRPRTEL